MKSNSLDQFYTKPIIVEKVLTNLFNLFYSCLLYTSDAADDCPLV